MILGSLSANHGIDSDDHESAISHGLNIIWSKGSRVLIFDSLWLIYSENTEIEVQYSAGIELLSSRLFE